MNSRSKIFLVTLVGSTVPGLYGPVVCRPVVGRVEMWDDESEVGERRSALEASRLRPDLNVPPVGVNVGTEGERWFVPVERGSS